ncbi:G-protein coupled receptor 26-like [Pangasianodon hypophthalmus]|uniref:G-protein coupled receptor 26-like n=1 Tax=Pangasianodon hypophthalmus TaxID=310915 RepID=UPI0023077A8A|nr:G-protein coupled receptor 26-like [Pangasianodon hypophthalmus]
MTHAAVPDLVLSALLVVISVVSLVSNALVLVCFLWSAEIRRHAPAVFVVNLSVCNLLLASSCMPATAVALVSGREQRLLQADVGSRASLCQLVGFLDTVLSANSMLSVAALSADRWLAVVFPLHYCSSVRRREAVLTLAAAWLYASCFAAVATCLSWVGYHQPYASCTLCAGVSESTLFIAYTLLSHVLTYLFALVVLSVAYLEVLRVARSHCKRIDVVTMQTLVLLIDLHPSVRQRYLEEKKKRRQRASRKVSSFIGTFVVCFTPYVLTRVVELFISDPVNPYWGVLCKSLAYSKAALDPCVYSLPRHQYRKTCSDIINRFLKKPSATHHSTNRGILGNDEN